MYFLLKIDCSRMISNTNKRKIIFVGGIHGVGKTTFCQVMASKLNIKHFSASHLISIEKADKHLSNKRVENINQNQDVLLTAINKHFNDETLYLLDGHFCLLNKDGQITRIPYSTYSGMNPDAIVVLIDEPENIYSRLSERDDIQHDLTLLRAFQEEEKYYAETIAVKLNIPYLIGNSTKSQIEIYSFVKNLMGQETSQ
jgi:adenylate kinase